MRVSDVGEDVEMCIHRLVRCAQYALEGNVTYTFLASVFELGSSPRKVNQNGLHTCLALEGGVAQG